MKKPGNADTALVNRLRKDDIKAFDALYRKYHQAVFRNILKFTKNTLAAEDILEDVFVTLWEKRGELDPHNSVSGWLFVISFNRSVNYMRSRLQETLTKDRLRSFLPREPGDEQALQRKDLLENQYYLLYQAIEHLSPQKKKVFSLCKLKGKSYEEAARQLNISKHTVKEYLSLAMIAVKDYIRKHPQPWFILLLFI